MDIKELEKPNYLSSTSGKRVIISSSITPLKLLQGCEDGEFEEIVCEWAYYYLKKNYEKISNIGGTGDKGRDIIAYKDFRNNVWDNFQCKQYGHPLAPNDILTEIGKLCYYCFTRQLSSAPKKYYFVCPMGVSSRANDLIREPAKIKAELLGKWGTCCKNSIVAGNAVALDAALREYIERFDFSIFDYVPPEDFISQYAKTPYYATRFGIMTKSRPLEKATPEQIQQFESNYIRKIFDAYSEYLSAKIDNREKLDAYPKLKEDFERQRNCFFCAESLNEFSRDIYAPELKHFENLKTEFYDGIIETIEDDAAHGFERLRKVLERATQLQVTNNPLVPYMKTNDRKGICHHLANERDDVTWKK